MAATSAKRTEIIRNEIRDYHRHTRERAVVKGEERDSKVVPTIPRARSCGSCRKRYRTHMFSHE